MIIGKIKILKVEPINFFLRSEMEKEVVLNSYKNIFKSIDYDIQTLCDTAMKSAYLEHSPISATVK